MSTGPIEPDPARTLDYWIPIPLLTDPGERQRWARTETARAVEVRGLGDAYATIIRDLLDGLVAQDRVSEAGFRLLFMVEPLLGASVWDVFVLVAGDALPDDIVQAQASWQLGVDVTTFEINGVPGTQAVGFELDQAPTDEQEAQIVAVATVTTRRVIADLGFDLVAVTRSVHLEAVTAALPAVQHLLASDDLTEVVPPTG